MRLGILIPSSNTIMEVEFREMLPKGFSVHTARMRLKEVTVEGLEEMEREAEYEALKLKDAGVDVIGYGCTSGSLIKGPGHDEILERRIEEVSGRPAVATSGAVLRALRTLNLRSLAVVTPYIDEINEKEVYFLERNGFEVLDLKAMKLKDNLEIGRVSTDRLISLVRELDHKRADGIFISCTNLPTIGAIAHLERELSKPVFSSNTATLWAMLRRAGSDIKIEGYGRLLVI
ncbi:MAG: maleate cis-trans isomerase [Candidatus Korarchaeum sp.]|nr:maleate cis-trans isomerase [Candidatus Korarchaeum sp.]MDW8035655.1 maleate cis-trans isomerase [Candidatus Korarchaeum sp.]